MFQQAFLLQPPLRRPLLRPRTSDTKSFPQCGQSGRLSGKTILVTGATGPTGRLICGALHARGAHVRALIRPRTYMYDRERVNAIRELCPDVRYVMGDLRDTLSIVAAVTGCHGVVSASGTRNFQGGDPNRPEIVDFKGLAGLVEVFLEAQLEMDLRAMLGGDERVRGGDSVQEEGVEGRGVVVEQEIFNASRFVLVSTLGVTRPERFPQLQQMGSLLTYKLSGEEALRKSGCPFTIIRPAGFVDGAPRENRVVIDQGDRLAGSIARADVAEICAEAIFCPEATNVTFECVAQPGVAATGVPISRNNFVGLVADVV